MGCLYLPATSTFAPSITGIAALSEAQLRALVAVTPLTFTAVPPNSGGRIALDRDSDGAFDVNAAANVAAVRLALHA